ncbi:MAG: 5-formyltetrahydrofolate cyclo-ligase [Acidaminococcales bacterium]|jgi:5-formyltetrahydrofolate cyclo-ligase|nr:5-formyltetrahydrofolate cyclo-ligase [Acidaminococcales bacterium]
MEGEKEIIRQKFAAIRDSYDPQWLEEKSRAVCARLLEWPVFAEAVHIMGYLSFGQEVALDGFLRQAAALGKKVYVPYVPPSGRKIMRAVRLRSFSGLVLGRYGIRAPENADVFIDPERLDLVLAPGLAFTEKGGRLGMGAGYYDRFLADLSETVKAGITLTPQIAPSLPLANSDVNMDFLVSERGITACRRI